MISMTAELIDGKKLADKIMHNVRKDIVENKLTPGLAVFLIGDDEASKLYVSLKEKACKKVGIDFHSYVCEKDSNQSEVLEALDFLNIPGRPWLSELSRYSIIPLLVMIILCIQRAEDSRLKLDQTLGRAQSEKEELETILRETTELRGMTERAEKEIESMRQELRSTYAYIQGMTLFIKEITTQQQTSFERWLENHLMILKQITG